MRRSLHGAIAGPWETWLALRGMRTLSVRLDRAQANAGELARRLSGHPQVEQVRYPGLAEHPGHHLAGRQMSGFGTMVAFDVAGGAAAADAVVGAVRVATAGTSLGGVETLIERRGRWEGERGLPAGLLRLSVGIEDVEDLWRDLDGALLLGAGLARPACRPGYQSAHRPGRRRARCSQQARCQWRRRAGVPRGITTRWPTPGGISCWQPGHTYRLRA